MRLQLYFSPGACSFVPHVLLQTTGTPYEPLLIKLHKGEQHSDAYKAINPHGQVPTVVLHPPHAATVVVTQLLAICLLLDDLFPQCHFLPREHLARARALSTLAWMNNTIHPTFSQVFMPGRFSDDSQVQTALRNAAKDRYTQLLGQLEAVVAAGKACGHAWLAGEHFGPLDAYALTLARWGALAGIDPRAAFPHLWAHVLEVAQLPAVVAVIAREHLQLNPTPVI